MSDLIDRQVAIDALEKVAVLFPWRVPGNRDSYDHYNEGWNDAIGRAEIEIEKLPSAQPEVLACGEGELSAQPEREKGKWIKYEQEFRLEEIAKRAMRTIVGEPFIMSLDDVTAIYEAIDMLRSQPEQHWIPCSERMPEKEEQVLIYAWNVHYVLAKYREIRTCDGVYKMAWVTEDAYSAPREIKYEVICWMPLPEPYAERRTDGD